MPVSNSRGLQSEIQKYVATKRSRTQKLRVRLDETMEMIDAYADNGLSNGEYLKRCNELKNHYEKLTAFDSSLQSLMLQGDALDDPKTLWKHDVKKWGNTGFLKSLMALKASNCHENGIRPTDIWLKNVVDVFVTDSYVTRWDDPEDPDTHDLVFGLIYMFCCILPYSTDLTPHVINKLHQCGIKPEEFFPELAVDSLTAEEEEFFTTYNYCPDHAAKEYFDNNFTDCNKADVILARQPSFIYFMCDDARMDCARDDDEYPVSDREKRMRALAFGSLLPKVYVDDEDLAKFIGVKDFEHEETCADGSSTTCTLWCVPHAKWRREDGRDYGATAPFHVVKGQEENVKQFREVLASANNELDNDTGDEND